MTNSPAPHTAIPSWSGYIYQGHVAVHHVLSLLCEDKDSTHVVQLDSLEDFAILKNNREIVSLHQVKAQAKGLFSAYVDSESGKNAFQKLKERADENNCRNAFFHLANEITDKNTSVIEADYPPIKIYKYGHKDECPLEQINLEVENRIKQYFEKHFPTEELGWRNAADYLKRARTFLYEIVQEKVLKIHAKGQRARGGMRITAFQESVELSAFATILNRNLNESQDKKYYLYLIRSDLRRYYLEFCMTLGTEMCEKMTDYWEIIENLDEENIVRFIQNISPHRQIKFNSLQDYHENTLIKDEVQGTFLQMLMELKKAGFKKEKNILNWENNEKEYFYPTTIQAGQQQLASVCQRIIKNAMNVDLGVTFERDSLVTSNMKADSVIEHAPNILESQDIKPDSIEYKRITNWKKISLVPLEEAKRAIND